MKLILTLLAALPLAAQDRGNDAPLPPSGEQQAVSEAPARRGDREAHRRRLIERFDADKDGKLNEEEKAAMDKFIEMRKQKRHSRDGQPERQRRQRMLKRFDKDGDGQLNDEERAEMERVMKERREAAPGRAALPPQE